MEETLLDLARKLRDTMESVWREHGYEKQYGFDQCDFATRTFLLLLRDRGIKGYEYVCGSNSEDNRHCWAEVEGYLIDITGDQFQATLPGAPGSVYVSRDKSWHYANFPPIPDKSAYLVDPSLSGKSPQQITEQMIDNIIKIHPLYREAYERLADT